jgi:Zn-dependent peptidase ImmA (M78 family)
MTPRPSRILSASEANGLWRLYGFGAPKELVLEDLALALGIVVLDGRLDSSLGRLVRSGETGIVRISDRIREPGRRRFVIAHEIGHWQLHKKVSHLLACTDEDMLASYKSSHHEVEASIFAGTLLMPDHLFEQKADDQRPTAPVLKGLAEYFGTSLTATALRFVEMSRDYCVFVISENNKIRWWRASESFGDHELWIENRTAVPRNSAAACFFRGEPVPPRPQRIDLRDWLGDLLSIDGDTVIEQAIPLSGYNQVLSMIWLP